MKKAVIILVILIALLPSALADWFYNSRNIIANIDISSGAEVVPSTPSGYIESAAINMTFFPKQTDNQELLSFYTQPKAEIAGNTLRFTWQRPEGEIEFGVNADVKTTNAIIEVRQKIRFPMEELPEEVVLYTRPSKTIDSNNEDIIRIASELVKGEDDLYSAVFKLADWTKNEVNYNLSTLSASVTQKASEVLQSKQGVCSDISSLFIALSRAIGIPARFVSGVAYTNSDLFSEHWGAHGWAEVYFQNYGWIPFDPTYGEYGWIDPTHIKFKSSVDSDEPSTYYQWLGRNADLKTRKLDIKTRLKENIGYFRAPLSMEVSALKKAIGFGSYNLVEANIGNLNDFYYATELYLTRPKEVKIAGNELKSILLLPGEKKKVFWIVKLDDDLDSRYSYTFPLAVSTLNNISSAASFTASSREKEVSLGEVEQTAKLLEEEKQKKYSGNVVLDCKASKEEFYEYEDAEVNCSAKNIGNVFLDNADVCFENECKKTSLGISQAKSVSFEINKSKTGLRESQVTLSNELVSKVAYVNFRIDDISKIEIEDLEFPKNVSYSENFTVYFTLAKKSQSNPKNVAVVFTLNSIEKIWNINELSENRKFVLDFAGSQLKYGTNKFRINVEYYDKLKKHYNTDKEFSIELANATILQRLLLSLNRFEGISHESIAIMLLTGTITFILVVLWLFRRNK